MKYPTSCTGQDGHPFAQFQTAIIPLEKQWEIKGGEDIIITDMVEG